ncbi:MAG: pentapeptide repeat-containing protein, partial [Pseudomonadota bacterium]
QVQRANFGNAQAQGANFGNAQLQGAYFGNAQVQRANFGNAQLQGAYFTNAQAQGADFRSAIFSTTTRFTRAEFLSALVAGTDFSMVSLTQEQVNAAFGDSSTKLSTGLSRPERHWPKWEMDLPTVYAQWEKYKTDPKSYVPPSPPDQSSDKPA